MIGRLRGVLALKSVEGVLIDVGGVGYDLLVPTTTLDRLPPEGTPCALHVHTHVREDQITLFGFHDPAERALFRQLLTVSGIGPRLALACLGMPVEDLVRAIRDDDLRRLSALPGIGKRTAQRIVLELRDKLPILAGAQGVAPGRGGALGDVDSALRNLGYRPKDVDAVVARLAETGDAGFEELLRQALQQLNAG